MISHFFKVLLAICKVTFSEMIRDKVLYNIILISILLLAIGFLASQFSFIRPERVVLDFGLSAINLSCALIAILGGSSLLGKEFERRTAHVTLSHPISRAQFVLGKYFGLLSVVLLNGLLLSIIHILILSYTSYEISSVLHKTYFVALTFILIQSVMISALAILFSSFTTTSLSVIFSIGCYLVGNNISQLKYLLTKISHVGGKFLLKVIIFLFPNYEYFNLGFKVTYGLSVPWMHVLASLTYGICFTCFVLFLSAILIELREV
ncbi:MAG: ABC transporter permease [Bdellovibrio sp.]|nr:ABC transporter permease [Bdellovibrio sp.]